ncbi:MAG: methionine synthase [Actinomycetota bacterium]|nr:methionine synthase [Actinomycetota bacterium]
MRGLGLPPGTVTGIGSLPGTAAGEWARRVLDLPLPFLPELPARGPHADLTGRTAALLTDLPVDLQPSGWRLVERPSRDGVRARDLLARDLDALEDAVGGAPLSRLKVQAAGPWTLAATLELTRGERALADPGAVRDLRASLAEGLSLHLADLRRRFPDVELVLQLDEPALPAVLAGAVPTPSGFGAYRVPEPRLVQEHLADVLAVHDRTVVHICAARPPVRTLRAAGASALALDLLLPQDEDALAEALEAGATLLAGVVAATGATPLSVDDVLRPLRELWRRLGLAAEMLPAVVLTPSCGLAGASEGYARAVLEQLGRAAAALEEEPL